MKFSHNKQQLFQDLAESRKASQRRPEAADHSEAAWREKASKGPVLHPVLQGGAACSALQVQIGEEETPEPIL